MAREQPEVPARRKPVPNAGAAWLPPAYELADVTAMQALLQGVADASQQRRALDWIIRHAAATYDFAYRPGGHDGERDTALALGRQMVGQQIVKLLNLNVALLRRSEPHADQPEPKS